MRKNQILNDPKIVKKIEGEMNALMEAARKQLDEWKSFLKTLATQITNLDGTPASAGSYVQDWVDQIKLDVVRTEAGEVQTVYDMPDGFITFLTNPPDYLLVPTKLLEALKGGHFVDLKPTATKEES